MVVCFAINYLTSNPSPNKMFGEGKSALDKQGVRYYVIV